MFDAKQMSAAIRAKKKKLMESSPELVDTDSRPDLNPMDMYNVDQKAQIEKMVDSPDKIDADETAMNEPYEQAAMSREPMSSHVVPKDHHKMAYGGAVEHGDPMLPSEMESESIAGSSETHAEMNQRIGEGFPVGGKGAGMTDMASEEMRRAKGRKMRLGSYLDSLDF